MINYDLRLGFISPIEHLNTTESDTHIFARMSYLGGPLGLNPGCVLYLSVSLFQMYCNGTSEVTCGAHWYMQLKSRAVVTSITEVFRATMNLCPMCTGSLEISKPCYWTFPFFGSLTETFTSQLILEFFPENRTDLF